MDICPFCGKAFKRLKSHLPHCKMARAKEEPPAIEHAQKNPTVTKTTTNKSLLSRGEKHSEVKGGDGRDDNRKQVPGIKNQRQHDHATSLYHKAEAKKSKILSGDRVTSPEPNCIENNQDRLKHDQHSMGQTEGHTHMTLPKEQQPKHFSKTGLAAPAFSESPEIDTSVEGNQIQVIGAQTPVTQARSQKLEPLRKPQLDQIASLSLRSKPVEGEVVEPLRPKLEPFRKPQLDQARSLSGGIKSVEVGQIHVEVSESSSSKLEPFRKPQRNHSISVSHRNKMAKAEVTEPPKLEPSREPQRNLATSLSHKNKLVEGGSVHLAVSESSTPFTQALSGGTETPEKASPGCVTVTSPNHLNHKQEAEAGGEGSPWYRQVSKGMERGANHFIRTDPLEQSGGHSGGDKREDDRSYWPTVSDSLKMEVGLVYGEDAATPTSLTQAPSGSPESLKQASEQNLTVMWENHRIEHKRGLNNTVEGKGGEGTPTYEGSRAAELGADHLNVATEDPLNRECFQKLTNQQLEIGSPFLLSTKVSAPYGSSNLVLQGVPGAVLEAEGMTPAQDLERAKKNMENELSRRPSALGLQWIPQLYSNYTQLKIVPGKRDQSGMDWRMGWTVMAEELSSDRGKPPPPELIPEAPLASRRLLDVRMRELPSWMSLRRIPELGRSACSRYYNKYIDVKKGGAGGLAMLLAAYCVLSYSWNFHHIRQDRWRKYH